jgi:hypothetical protein
MAVVMIIMVGIRAGGVGGGWMMADGGGDDDDGRHEGVTW